MIAVAAALLLLGCTPSPDGFAPGERPEDDDDATPRPWITCPEDGCAADVNVALAADLAPPCPDPDCTADYLAFAEAAAPFGVPVDRDALEADVLALAAAGDVPTPPELDASALRAALIEATVLGFLIDGLDERPLEVEVTETRATDWGREEHLVVRDPWIGSMTMVLLRPAGAGPFPGLVAAPGHGECWFDMRDAHDGDVLAAAGWAVLILDTRASGADEAETEVTKTLLAAGLSFLGVRVYEQLLARKILRWRSDVHPDLVAVWGHSGGSVVANLTVRLGGFAGLVSDLEGAYLNVIPDGPWLDETCPAAHALHPAINDRSTLTLPVYDDDYGYPAGVAAIRGFLRSEVLGL